LNLEKAKQARTLAAEAVTRCTERNAVPKTDDSYRRAFPSLSWHRRLRGGLEALEQFLKHVPEGSGMAFAIVQHLDPTHKDIMPEILQRATAMQVLQVKDRMKVKPDRVYVIPPTRTCPSCMGSCTCSLRCCPGTPPAH